MDNNRVLAFSVDVNGYVIAIDQEFGGQWQMYQACNTVTGWYFSLQAPGPTTLVPLIKSFQVLANGHYVGPFRSWQWLLVQDITRHVQLRYASLTPAQTNVQSFTVSADDLTYTVEYNSSSALRFVEEAGEIVAAALISYFVPVAGAALGEMIVGDAISTELVSLIPFPPCSVRLRAQQFWRDITRCLWSVVQCRQRPCLWFDDGLSDVWRPQRPHR